MLRDARACGVQLLVARMVTAAFAKAVAAAEAEEKWQQEVQLLRARVDRMGRMEEAIERARLADEAARQTLRRRILHVTLATCCGAVGVAGAIVFISHIRAQD